MFKSIVKSTAMFGLVALTSLPAAAQIRFRADLPIPGVQIRIGHRPPPAPRYEQVVYSTRPARDYVWVNGYWDWQGDDWAWVGGRWERPAYRDVRWVAPRYVQTAYGVRYEPGHWSNQRLVEGDEFRRARYRDRDRYRDRRYRDSDRDGVPNRYDRDPYDNDRR